CPCLAPLCMYMRHASPRGGALLSFLARRPGVRPARLAPKTPRCPRGASDKPGGRFGGGAEPLVARPTGAAPRAARRFLIEPEPFPDVRPPAFVSRSRVDLADGAGRPDGLDHPGPGLHGLGLVGAPLPRLDGLDPRPRARPARSRAGLGRARFRVGP